MKLAVAEPSICDRIMAANSALECRVCHEEYNSDKRCPRTFCCSHTLCSECIGQLISSNTKTCPFCRGRFQADEVNNVMVNHTALDLLTYIAQMSSGSCPTSRKMRIRKLKNETKQNTSILLRDCQETETHIEETMKDITNMEANIAQENAKIEKEIYPKLRNVLTSNNRVIRDLRGLYNVLHSQLKEVQVKEKEIKQMAEKLKYSSPTNTFQEAGALIDEIEENNQSINEWFQNVKGLVDDEQGLFQAVDEKMKKAKMKIHIVLEILKSGPADEWVEYEGSSEDDQNEDEDDECKGGDNQTDGDSEVWEDDEAREDDEEYEDVESEELNDDETNTNSHMDAVAAEERELPQGINIKMLRKLSYPMIYLVENGRIFACQQGGERTRYAKISISDEGWLCLHALELRRGSLPHNVRVVEHAQAMSLVNVASKLTFLDLSVGQLKLGRVYIRLTPDTPFAQNFAYLCTGEKGPSYAKTNFLAVGHRGHFQYEWIRGGDHEANDGTRGAGIINGLGSEGRLSQYRCRSVAGIVTADWDVDDGKSGRFVIRTRDNSDTECQPCFGRVEEEGLHILIDAIAQYENISDVSIHDCGIVLPR